MVVLFEKGKEEKPDTSSVFEKLVMFLYQLNLLLSYLLLCDVSSQRNECVRQFQFKMLLQPRALINYRPIYSSACWISPLSRQPPLTQHVPCPKHNVSLHQIPLQLFSLLFR